MNLFFRKRLWPALMCGLALCSPRLIAQEVKTENDVVYTETPDPASGKILQTKLDLYRPDNSPGKHPTVLLIHGGGWIFGDKGQYKSLAQELAKAGYVAVSLNYRLSPKFHFPAALDDVQRAVRWVRAHADQYGIDPDNLGAMGDSAGAHLAAFLGVRDTRDNSDEALAKYSSRVKCVLDLYPPTDFTLPPNAAKVSNEGMQLLVSFFGKKPQDAPELYKDGSPITFVDKSSAPFLIFHGDEDKLVPIDQSRRLHEALKKANVESTLVIFANEGHGFKKAGSLASVRALAFSFFDRHLKEKH